MYQKEFLLSFACLREKNGVSTRNISLSIEQNVWDINNTENGKVMWQ